MIFPFFAIFMLIFPVLQAMVKVMFQLDGISIEDDFKNLTLLTMHSL